MKGATPRTRPVAAAPPAVGSEGQGGVNLLEDEEAVLVAWEDGRV